MYVQLIPVGGGEPIRLEKVVSVVGRNRKLCDICLKRSGVSKLHCVIVQTEDLLFVRELGSTNGTRVNGKRVMEKPLRPGDTLAFGSAEFRVQCGLGDPGISPGGDAEEAASLSQFLRTEGQQLQDVPSGEHEAVGPPQVIILSGSDSAPPQATDDSDRSAAGIADAKPKPPASKTDFSDTELLRVLNEPVESASEPKPQSMPPHSQKPREQTPLPPREGRPFTPTVDRKGATARRGRAEAGESFLDKLRNNRKAVAGGAAVVLLTWMVLSSWQSSDSDQEVYDVYDAIWTEIQTKRAANASQAEWKEFTERAKAQFEPFVETLKKTARTSKPLKQELLYCGRDYLPHMLMDARTEPSESEQMFREHMETAKGMLQGKP